MIFKLKNIFIISFLSVVVITNRLSRALLDEDCEILTDALGRNEFSIASNAPAAHARMYRFWKSGKYIIENVENPMTNGIESLIVSY